MMGDRRRRSIASDVLFEITRQRIADLRCEARRSHESAAASASEK
jgi:hypothetical protein